MSAAEIIQTSLELQSWTTLCQQYPDEWVCLIDVEDTADGTLHAARLLAHARSIEHLLEQIDLPQPGTVVVHTWGRWLTFPRLEMTDEIRDLLQSDQ